MQAMSNTISMEELHEMLINKRFSQQLIRSEIRADEVLDTSTFGKKRLPVISIYPPMDFPLHISSFSEPIQEHVFVPLVMLWKHTLNAGGELRTFMIIYTLIDALYICLDHCAMVEVITIYARLRSFCGQVTIRDFIDGLMRR
eukprot:6473479-Amphidinium_carterae.1